MAKILYDEKTNTISFRFSNKKSVDSDARKNVVIDYDKKGEIVGVEVMGVSLEEFSEAAPRLRRIFRKERIVA